jgi:hypothetical protein
MIAAGVLLAIGLAYASLTSSTIFSKRPTQDLSMPSVYFSTEHEPVVKKGYSGAYGQDEFIYTYYYSVNYTTNATLYYWNGTEYFSAYVYMGPDDEGEWLGSANITIFPLLYARLDKLSWENSSLVAYVDVYVRGIYDVYIGYNSSLYQILSIHEYLLNNLTVIELELQISKNILPGSVLLIPVWTTGKFGESVTFIAIPISRGY